MAEVFGKENWIAINIDAHFDVRADNPRNSGTPYRQLLEEKLAQSGIFLRNRFSAAARFADLLPLPAKFGR
jgi:arginase family enzyme